MAHRSLAELAADLESGSDQVEVGGRYLHYKRDDRPYLVTGLVILEDSEALAVAYCVQDEPRVSFIRPLASWLETVEWQGQIVPRFTIIV